MGNFEKLVVLAVLFAAAIVLAISFHRGSDSVEAADPMSGAREVLGQEEPGPGALPVQTSDQSAPSLLLNAGEGAEPSAATAPASAGLEPVPAGLQSAAAQSENALALEPVSDPTHRILTSTNGLRPSFAEDYMVYRIEQGDNWPALAQRFYQDGRYTRNLMRANDDLPELKPGDEILVPIFDFLTLDAQPSAAPASELATHAPAESAPAPKSLDVASPAGAKKTLEYEVKPGDTLSDISLAVFGTSTRWKELLEANRELLHSPEGLQVGMKLKIPAGGKLPVAGASKPVAKKPEAKPAEANAKSEAPKKKKVL